MVDTNGNGLLGDHGDTIVYSFGIWDDGLDQNRLPVEGEETRLASSTVILNDADLGLNDTEVVTFGEPAGENLIWVTDHYEFGGLPEFTEVIEFDNVDNIDGACSVARPADVEVWESLEPQETDPDAKDFLVHNGTIDLTVDLDCSLVLDPPAETADFTKYVKDVVDVNDNGVTDAGDIIRYGFNFFDVGLWNGVHHPWSDTGAAYRITLNDDLLGLEGIRIVDVNDAMPTNVEWDADLGKFVINGDFDYTIVDEDVTREKGADGVEVCSIVNEANVYFLSDPSDDDSDLLEFVPSTSTNVECPAVVDPVDPIAPVDPIDPTDPTDPTVPNIDDEDEIIVDDDEYENVIVDEDKDETVIVDEDEDKNAKEEITDETDKDKDDKETEKKIDTGEAQDGTSLAMILAGFGSLAAAGGTVAARRRFSVND